MVEGSHRRAVRLAGVPCNAGGAANLRVRSKVEVAKGSEEEGEDEEKPQCDDDTDQDIQHSPVPRHDSAYT